MSNFDLDLSGSKHTHFDPSRREEHCAVRIYVLALSVQKLSAKTQLVIFGHLPDLRHHQLTETIKIRYHQFPLVMGNIRYLYRRATPGQKGKRGRFALPLLTWHAGKQTLNW